jgi:hypothetical protein
LDRFRRAAGGENETPRGVINSIIDILDRRRGDFRELLAVIPEQMPKGAADALWRMLIDFRTRIV